MAKKLTTLMNTMLIYKDGELIEQYSYRTKTQAINEYKHRLKHGHMNKEDGTIIQGCKFFLL